MKTNYEAMTDAELSEAVAVKCAGWRRATQWDRAGYGRKKHLVKWICEGPGGGVHTAPHFATSADAVLPLLEKFQWVDISREHEAPSKQWEVAISLTREEISRIYYASASTLARAACLALLKAKDAAPL